MAGLWLVWALCGGARAQQPEVAPSVRTETLDDGSVRLVPDRQVPQDLGRARAVLLNFGEVSLYELATYFADAMRKNFLLTDDAALQGKKVRLVGHEEMSIAEAWEAFQSALRAHGFTVTESGEVVTIVPSKDAIRGAHQVVTGPPGPPSDAFVTQLLPVHNAKVADIAPVLRPLLSTEAELVPYLPANTLIVTDTATNVRKVAELVRAIDVAAPETTLRSVRLEHAVAAEVATIVSALFLQPEAPAKPEPRPTRRQPKGAPPQATVAGEASRHVTQVLDDARTNTLLILANPEGHAAVAELVAELDVDVDATARKRLHVVRLKYALAEEMASVISSLQQPGAARPQAPRAKPAGKNAEDEPAASFDGDARIAPDPATNSLAIVASPEEYEGIAELVAELDVARGQVYVDAVFVELTSSGGREIALGAHALPTEDQPGWASAQLDTAGKHSSLAVSPDLLTGLAAGVFGPMIDVAGPDGPISVPTFGIALRALQIDSDLQIMGNPGVLALDHHPTSLVAGRKIPYQTSVTPTAIGAPIYSYDRLDVTTTLEVTPHINDPTLVTLDIELVVDDAEGGSVESALAGGPTTTTRSVTSRVMAEDGQTVVIAGVAGTKLEVLESKVPILGDIPLLGALFRSRSRESRSTNLMVFLTPYVVNQPADVLRIRRIKEAQRLEFVRRFQGKQGEDWLEELDALLADAEPAQP
jgi:general secretion pathway protein D